jgi:peptide/nickel transport system permease protein
VSLLLIGLATTCLLRLAPGFGADERELDSRLSNESIDRLKDDAIKGNILQNYGRFLAQAVKGDFGFSNSLNRPVRELIEQRYATSLKILAFGLASGWLPAFLLAAAGGVLQARAIPTVGTLTGALILCVPSALLAYVCYFVGAPAYLVVGLVIFARVFRVIENVFRSAQQEQHVLAARAQGLSELRIFTKHVLAATSAETVALAGASVSMAVSATIAAEALCGEPGLGQLAWKAALARDLPLLVTLTLLIGAVTLFCNRTADAFVQDRRASA